MPEPTVPVPDLESCAREPIRVPGSIQPQGALFVIDAKSFVIEQAAVGTDDALARSEDLIGADLRSVLLAAGQSLLRDLNERVRDAEVLQLGVIEGRERRHHLLAHRSGESIIVEVEATAERTAATLEEIFPNILGFVDTLSRSAGMEQLAELAAREVRAITGFDRVLVYRFDEQWNGAVIGEDRNDRLPSYLGLRFPASDIPAQARDLYRLNRFRLIADANYQPKPIEPEPNPRTGQPVDLTYSVLRSVSPIHLEYMRNMGTMASMSISLLRGNELWGLISCHHRDPVLLPYPVRAACDFIGRVLSMQINALESAAAASLRSELQTIQARLLAHMATASAMPDGGFVQGLLRSEADLLSLTDADGAAIVVRDAVVTVGCAPPEADVRTIVQWLADGNRDELFVSDQLTTEMPGSEKMKDAASGLLAISISQLHDSYVLWFRPEVIRTVTWGGQPKKLEEPGDGARIHPRKSFAAWQEIVQLQSRKWLPAQVEAAAGLRTAIVDIVLRQAEELAAVSDRLAASNKELEAFSYSVSHDLRAPFRHIVGYAQLLKKNEGASFSPRADRYIETIIESALSAGTLVDDLLSFSQMGRRALVPVGVNMNQIVDEVRRMLIHDEAGRNIEWRVGELPTVSADPMMLKIVVQNLLDNALKFTRGRNPARIDIGGEETEDQARFFVADNGAGFDMSYVGKLFGVFQRLHRVEDFEGTGIGLANVKRVIERHGGTIDASGAVDEGARFVVTLPKRRN